MSFGDVWQLPDSSNPYGVLSGHRQIQTAAVRNFNAATTSMGLVNAMHNTPVIPGGPSASFVPTEMSTAIRPYGAVIPASVDFFQLPYHRFSNPIVMFQRKSTLFESRLHSMCTARSERWPLTGKTDFEKSNLAVRLYNQLELLGLPNWAELCYISENLALMCTHGTIKTFSHETFSQLQTRLVQFDPAQDGDPPAWATPPRLPDGADGFDLYRIRIEIGGRCFATTNWHPFLSLPRALAERIEYLLTVVNAEWRRKGWVAPDSVYALPLRQVDFGAQLPVLGQCCSVQAPVMQP